MPKLKTNRAANKRFKVTGTGKIKRTQAGKQHILGKKSPKRIRTLRKSALVDDTNLKPMRKMIPYK